MDKFIEVFLLTNGSDTFPVCLEYLKKQTLDVKFTIVENMNIIDAMNYCINNATSKYFVKLDDDMILHPKALEYLNHCLYKYEYRIKHKDQPEIGMYFCNLWEFWADRVVKCIKAYNVLIAKEIGFKKDQRGKIDRIYINELKSRKISNIHDKSVIALHSLRNYNVQKNYRNIWMKNADIYNVKDFETKDRDQSILHNITINHNEYDYKVKQLYKINKNFNFKKFIK